MPTAAASSQASPLEVMALELGPREFHFYSAGGTMAEFAPLIAPTLAGTQALILSIPTGLLNPNYWEPLTTEGEEAVRRAGAAVITREESGAAWLWRSDTIAPGRYLRDGVDVAVERVDGAAFKIAGPDLLKLGAAWAASPGTVKDRFEWAAFKPPASGDGLAGISTDAKED